MTNVRYQVNGGHRKAWVRREKIGESQRILLPVVAVDDAGVPDDIGAAGKANHCENRQGGSAQCRSTVRNKSR